MTYTKLFGSILDSTVWRTPAPTRLVWITMLAMCDRDGVVEASVPGLALRAGVAREDAEAALLAFLSPDPDSRTPDFEGRRIEKVDGGWRLLNHGKYRDRLSLEDRRERDRIRQRRKRERDASRDVTLSHARSRSVTLVTPSDADAGSDAKADVVEPATTYRERVMRRWAVTYEAARRRQPSCDAVAAGDVSTWLAANALNMNTPIDELLDRILSSY